MAGNPLSSIDPKGLAYSPRGEHGVDWDGTALPKRKKRMKCENKCIQAHYFSGSNYSYARGANAAGAAPIPKSAVGMPTMRGASPVTNPISGAGHAMTGPKRGKIGRRVLGTNRWFGLAGRLNLAAFVGMTTYDVVTIEQCVQECVDDECQVR